MKQKSELFKFRPVFHGSMPRKIFIILIFAISQIVFFSSDSFRLTEIEIKGLDRLEGNELVEQCYPPWGKHIWLVDVRKIRDRLATVPWIKDSRVKKVYPDKLALSVTERDLAIAMASSDNKDEWYGADADGCILIKLQKGKEKSYTRLVVDEPMILNTEIDKKKIKLALETNEMIGEKDRKLITHYKIDRMGSISFFYAPSPAYFEVKLGKPDDIKGKLDIFEAIMTQIKAAGTARNQLNDIAYVDLRKSNRPAIGMKTGKPASEPAKRSDAAQAADASGDGREEPAASGGEDSQ